MNEEKLFDEVMELKLKNHNLKVSLMRYRIALENITVLEGVSIHDLGDAIDLAKEALEE